jgi:DNA-directed RNA polymerase specialized sigma24 family protein
MAGIFNPALSMGERGQRSIDALPQSLVRVLDARDQPAVDAAWSAFVAEYSGLLLQVARSTTSGHDAAMDAYAFVLDQLRENSGNRLRSFDARSGAQFSTWLLVVARRLCIDFRRRRYGRRQTSHEPHEQATVDREARRRFVDLAAEQTPVTRSRASPGGVAAARRRRPSALKFSASSSNESVYKIEAPTESQRFP